ncbi:uncharacterized protein LOC134720923 [Mytilus trossulus]|uniref:uncharacterized protein LOC134720923 n=1 Tax=Mytilus trossulus TaxID=6551 RepID=UPI0030041E36
MDMDDLYENKHTRTTNVDGSEPTSTNKQPSKRILMFPGMVQSITNFENNRVLYNAFRKYKLASLKRQRRSISIPSFLQKRLDKPIKVYNNAYESGKRRQNSIQIKGTNKVRKMFFEVPNNTHGSIKTHTESYKGSKLLKTEPVMKVSSNSALDNMKNSVHQSEKYSGSSGVVIHQYTTEKPRLQKRRKSRHTKRHIKDGLFRRISKSLSNGLPIYSKAKTESTLEKKPTKPDNRLTHGNGMRINLGNIKQTQQATSRSKDVIKVNKKNYDLSQSRAFMSGDHYPASKTAIKPMNVFYDTKFELPKTSNSADSFPKPNDQWYEMPQSNTKSILKTNQHNINNDNNHNSFPVDTAITLNRRKMPTYKSPFIPSNQMIDTPSNIDVVRPTKILSYHSSDSSSNGLSSTPDKSFAFNPQPHHDSITDRTKFVSGLSEFNDMAVENDFPNFNNRKPSESNLNGQTDYILNLNDIGTGQIEKSPLDNVRPNVINLSNIKIVPGGCIIEGRFYRYEELPKFIQDFYDNKTKNEHLKLSLGDVENVLNDYTENTGSISQSFSNDFPMLELIKGNDSSPFSIQLPGDSQGYDILVDPNLHEGSLELAVLHANNFAAGNDRFGSPRTMVSRPDKNNRQTIIKGKENNRQSLSPVLKWSEGVNDKAGTDLAPIPNYQVASDIRVVNSLSADRFGARNDDPNDFSVSKLNGNRFGSYNNGRKEVISLPGMRIKDQKVLTKFFNQIHISSKNTVPPVQRKTSHQYKMIEGAPSDIISRGFLDIPLNSMAAKLPLSKPLKKTENTNTKTSSVARQLGLVREQAKPDAQSNDEAEELVFKNPRQNIVNHNAQSNNVADKLGFRSLVLENAFKDPPLNAVTGKLSLNSQVEDEAIQNVQSSGEAIKNKLATKLGLKSKVQDKGSQDSQSNTIKEQIQDKKQSDDKADKLKSNKVILQGKTQLDDKADKLKSNKVTLQGKPQLDDKADTLKSNKVIQENDHRETSRVDLVSGSRVNTKPRDTYPHDMRKNSSDDKLNKHKGKHDTSHNDMWLNGLDGKPVERLNTGIQNKIPNDIKSNGGATKKRLNSRKQDKTIRHEKQLNRVVTKNTKRPKTIRHEKQLNRVVTKNTKRPKKTVLRDGALKPNDKVFSLFKDNKNKSKQLKNNPFANLKNILKATSSAKKSVASNVRSVQKGPRTFFDIIENNIISPFKSVPVDTQLKDNFASNFNLGEILKNGVSAFHHEPVTFPNFIAPPKRNLIMSPTAIVPLHLAGQHNLESIMNKIVTTPFGMRQNTIMNIFG